MHAHGYGLRQESSVPHSNHTCIYSASRSLSYVLMFSSSVSISSSLEILFTTQYHVFDSHSSNYQTTRFTLTVTAMVRYGIPWISARVVIVGRGIWNGVARGRRGQEIKGFFHDQATTGADTSPVGKSGMAVHEAQATKQHHNNALRLMRRDGSSITHPPRHTTSLQDWRCGGTARSSC